MVRRLQNQHDIGTGVGDFRRHTDGRGRHVADTFTCSHCAARVVNDAAAQLSAHLAGEMMGAHCGGCFGMICRRCVPKGRCNTSDARAFRLAQDRARFLREVEAL